MNGNRRNLRCPPVHTGRWRTRPHNSTPVSGATILRHSEPASRPRPLPRVDLRSSLDPDPSPAYVRTHAGNTQKPVTKSPTPGLTRPHSFRDESWTKSCPYRARGVQDLQGSPKGSGGGAAAPAVRVVSQHQRQAGQAEQEAGQTDVQPFLVTVGDELRSEAQQDEPGHGPDHHAADGERHHRRVERADRWELRRVGLFVGAGHGVRVRAAARSSRWLTNSKRATQLRRVFARYGTGHEFARYYSAVLVS